MVHRLWYMRRHRRYQAGAVEATKVAACQVPQGRLLLRIRREVDHWANRPNVLGSIYLVRVIIRIHTMLHGAVPAALPSMGSAIVGV